MKYPTRRGTAIISSSWKNVQGILVVGDPKGIWMLPGGQAERNEARISATIRELKEEIGLEAEAVKYLFRYDARNSHKVFAVTAPGIPRICDPREGIAIGVCRHDMTVDPIVTLRSGRLPQSLSRSTRAIIKRFNALTSSEKVNE